MSNANAAQNRYKADLRLAFAEIFAALAGGLHTMTLLQGTPDAQRVADTLGQPRDHELMALYAQAARSLGMSYRQTLIGTVWAILQPLLAELSSYPKAFPILFTTN